MATLICFEGIDGSGKTAQISLLADTLTSLGKRVCVRSYPVYDSFFGQEVGRLLAGSSAGTDAARLDPQSMALWYALDRWLDHRERADIFRSDMYVLLNRYTLSNVVYQSLRSSAPTATQQWIDQLEHAVLGLPRPDLYVVLDTPPAFAGANVLAKQPRAYTADAKDVYERDLHLQHASRDLYLALGEHLPNACVIRSYDEGGLLPPATIAEQVLAAVRDAGLL